MNASTYHFSIHKIIAEFFRSYYFNSGVCFTSLRFAWYFALCAADEKLFLIIIVILNWNGHIWSKKFYFRRLPSDFKIIFTDILPPRSEEVQDAIALLSSTYFAMEKMEFPIIERNKVLYQLFYVRLTNSKNII